MPQFSERSRTKLQSCHEDLQRLFNEVVKRFDCTIIQGHRGMEEQNEAYATGHSQLKFPESKHNKSPSMAVDVMPYKAWSEPHVDWDDIETLLLFIGFVKGVAWKMGIKVRSGIDWDDDFNIHEHRFMDYPHWELVDELED